MISQNSWVSEPWLNPPFYHQFQYGPLEPLTQPHSTTHHWTTPLITPPNVSPGASEVNPSTSINPLSQLPQASHPPSVADESPSNTFQQANDSFNAVTNGNRHQSLMIATAPSGADLDGGPKSNWSDDFCRSLRVSHSPNGVPTILDIIGLPSPPAESSNEPLPSAHSAFSLGDYLEFPVTASTCHEVDTPRSLTESAQSSTVGSFLILPAPTFAEVPSRRPIRGGPQIPKRRRVCGKKRNASTIKADTSKALVAARVRNTRPINNQLDLRDELALLSAKYTSDLTVLLERSPVESLVDDIGILGKELLSCLKATQRVCTQVVGSIVPSEQNLIPHLQNRLPIPTESTRKAVSCVSHPTSPGVIIPLKHTSVDVNLPGADDSSRPATTESEIAGTTDPLSYQKDSIADDSSPSVEQFVPQPPPMIIHGPWHDLEIQRLRSLIDIASSSTEIANCSEKDGEVIWDWVSKEFGPTRSRHQVLCKSVELGWKKTGTRASRKVRQRAFKVAEEGMKGDLGCLTLEASNNWG